MAVNNGLREYHSRMKNQYVADINDYRKYGLIRTLTGFGKIRTGVCWMLTPDDSRTDGQFTRYVSSPGQWSHFDPCLFKLLGDFIRDGYRHVGRIESSGLFQNAMYHSQLLSDLPEERRLYFAKMQERLNDADLIFFDPDNGIEIKSRPYGRRQSSKFLYWHELAETFRNGKSVLMYQHFIRENREQFITRLSSEIIKRLGSDEIFSFRTAHVVFFLVPQPKHSEFFKKSADAVAYQWRGQIEVSAHG